MDGAGLAAARAEVAARIAGLEEDLERLFQATAGANADDEHDPEGATIAFERAQLVAVLDSARRRLAELDRAGERLAAGTYGRCESCGGPIGAERLAARPTTTTCLRCAARARR